MKKILTIFVCTSLLCMIALSVTYSQDKDILLPMLVNKENRLDAEYIPSGMIDISDLVNTTKNQILLKEDAYIDYDKMVKQMDLEGISDISVVSGYRNYSYQDGLYQKQIGKHSDLSEQEAIIKAGQVVAPPGTSEHQTGLAIDVSSSEINYRLNNDFTKTEAFKWLEKNSWKYGFILRYDRDKTAITDIIYEPWHYRYVGFEHASAMYEMGLCLEEYIEYLTK